MLIRIARFASGASCSFTDMAIACKPVLKIRLCVAMLMLSQPCWAARPLDEAVMGQCKNLFTHDQGVVVNGVFIPRGATRSVRISRTQPTITIQLLVTSKPVNAVYDTVPITMNLVLGWRPVVLELRSCCSRDFRGCERGDVFVMLQRPSLLTELSEFVVSAARFSGLRNSEPRNLVPNL